MTFDYPSFVVGALLGWMLASAFFAIVVPRR